MASAEPEFDPSQHNATLQLWSHILQKGLQGGGILGIAVGVPMSAYRARVISADLATAAVGRTALAFSAVVVALGIYKFTQIDQDGLYDRVYRLHYNQTQNRTDRFAQVGAALGLAATAAFVSRRPINLFGGAAAGAGFGALAHVATSTKQANAGPNRMMHELKT